VSRYSPLRGYFSRITVAGCLAMVYVTFVSSPVTTEFFRNLGATDLHFGLIGGIPMIMLSMQFVGAYVSGRVARRKPWFIVFLVAGRFVYLPIAFLPFCTDAERCPRVIAAIIVLMGFGAAALNFGSPFWFSWMGDLIPRRILNRYWGTKHRYMTLVWTMAFLAVAVFMFYSEGLSPRVAFSILASVGVIAGVVDVLLFIRVKEPPNHKVGPRHPLEILFEPLAHKEFRTMIRFRCAFAASMMVAAAFMQVYILKVLGLPVWLTTLMWCSVGLGGALIARTWGFIADHHGHRPVILLCACFKPAIALAFLLVTPRFAFPVLAVAFLFDSMLNAGQQIAVNGYTLKMAPRENRSMFVAAGMALAGFAGGLGAIAGGLFLRHTEGFAIDAFGRRWVNYHLVFLASVVLRALCIPLAASIREPASANTIVVANYLRGAWPLRLILYPVGLYRRARLFRNRSNTTAR